MDNVVASAINKAGSICGGISSLASAIGIRPSAISNWKARGSKIDPKHCAAIERATLGAVTRQALRPDDWRDIWPELAGAAQEAAKKETVNA